MIGYLLRSFLLCSKFTIIIKLNFQILLTNKQTLFKYGAWNNMHFVDIDNYLLRHLVVSFSWGCFRCCLLLSYYVLAAELCFLCNFIEFDCIEIVCLDFAVVVWLNTQKYLSNDIYISHVCYQNTKNNLFNITYWKVGQTNRKITTTK